MRKPWYLLSDTNMDTRFARHRLPYVEQKKALKLLVQSYLATFNDLKVETWLMHGSLLGWWWGQKVSRRQSCLVFSSFN